MRIRVQRMIPIIKQGIPVSKHRMQQDPRTDHSRNINKGLYPLLQQPCMLIPQQKHYPQQAPERSDKYYKEHDDPARILRLSQHTDLPRSHTGKNNHADNDHTKTETVPPDHDTGHTFHPDRQKRYGNDRGNSKTDDQLIYGR